MQITYISETDKEYVAELGNCISLAELRELLGKYRELVADAIAAIPKDEDEFAEFRAGLKSERRRIFAGEAWAARYGSIVVPEIMLKISMFATLFRVPWGTAYLRLKEAGQLAINDQGFVIFIKDSK